MRQENRDSSGELLPPLPIPIQMTLFDQDSGAAVETALLVLEQREATFSLADVTASAVVASLLQDFSAPVRLDFPQQSEADLLFLLQHDTDAFSRWESQQRLTSRLVLGVAALGNAASVRVASVLPSFIEAFKHTLRAAQASGVVWRLINVVKL